jgi:hypothetical protein
MKTENKAYEEMLEEESLRKEGEIRKLKEEAILKEKTFKTTKIEITQLQTENTALKVPQQPLRNNSPLPARAPIPTSSNRWKKSAPP